MYFSLSIDEASGKVKQYRLHGMLGPLIVVEGSPYSF